MEPERQSRHPNPALLIAGTVNLLKSLTTRRFCAALLQHVNTIVHVDHIAIVRHTRGRGVQLFGSESVTAFVAHGARAVLRYIDRHHRLDPIRRLLHAKHPETPLARYTGIIRRERASDVNDPVYRRECYDAAGIIDRVSVAAIDGCGGLVSLELQRQSSSGEFTDEERETLAGAAPLLTTACTRHVELLMLGGADNDAWRARLTAVCPDMTERELDVTANLLAGRTLRECAAALGVAHSSVVTYCERAYSRLGVRNLRELRSRFAAGETASTSAGLGR